MIAAPYPGSPRLGPLAAPTEKELVAAYPELRAHALTLPWAAERLGLQPATLVARARAGELVLIPGPWPMRQAHASGLGYLLPAWQLTERLQPLPDLPALIATAAELEWTSLDLHRFMTSERAGDELERVTASRRRGGRRRRRNARAGAPPRRARFEPAITSENGA